MTTQDCLFCKIARGEIKADVVLDEPDLIVFRDIQPRAPTHVLVIPKKHLAGLSSATASDDALLGKLLGAARRVAAQLALTGGYRTVINDGPDAGQSVPHLHLHLLAGRPLSWPPG